MKLERIQLVNFLSHAATDWEPNGTRLAAVVGANGAGKSALLDGVLYAMYDAARARTDGLVRLGETDMSAVVIFTFNGQRYRIARGRSSKGAGKTFLEVAVEAGDGTWTSLTSDDIRSTQTVIDELLGLDAEAFTTSVFLKQGESDAFVTATAGDRKKLLSTLLGLDVYAKAESRARDEARTLEATTLMDRSSLDRTTDVIAELEPVRDVVSQRTAEIHAIAQQQTAAAAERDRIQARLTELAAEIARGETAAAEVTRLEAERGALGERYRREQATIVTAEATIIQAEAIITGGAEVDAAIASLSDARADVEVLVRAEVADRQLGIDIAERRKTFDPADTAHRELLATWGADLRHAQARVSELIAAVNALEPVICRQCGTSNVVDQAGLNQQLVAARARVAELEAGKPAETMDHSRERVAIKRLEERRADAGWDPEPLSLARGLLRELEQTAARAGEISNARYALEAATAAKVGAEAELARIDAAGQELRSRLNAAWAATAGSNLLVGERDGLEGELTMVGRRIETLQQQRLEAERGLAQAEAQIVRLVELTADRDEIAARLQETDVDLARLRRLVGAFGVTGIPARIIESVLPELSGYANELLGELRPGMVLEIRAQREKKSGKGVVEALDLIVRDDVGERPLALFSGGERMGVSLAIATALSRLVARRAGTAIRSLVIDEPDGLDADARRSFGQALRVLAHHGELERVVLVSHHPDLAEYADDVWSVTKGPGGSVVELVA